VKEDERPAPPPAAAEKEMLAAFLDWHRATLLWKCEGLTADELKRRAVPPSTLSLLGLVRHLTDVERGWFRRGLGREKVDFVLNYDDDAEPDFDDIDSADADADLATYRAEVDLCRKTITATTDLDAPVDGDRSARWILLHMLEEYARHNGHADLLRQAIDGATGE
jgi:uncharacterized damage-inducible protein DinB